MNNILKEKTSLAIMLRNGVHIGHHVNKWNSETGPYLLGQRGNIHIIDLEKTLFLLRKTLSFVSELSSRGGSILFISTMYDFSNIVEENAKKCGQPYVNRRWIGGLLTNFTHIKKKLRNPKGCSEKFIFSTQGIRNMERLPSAIFIVGVNNCRTALLEASKLNIPTIAIVDSNTSIQDITYPIPGNDDSILAVNLYCQLISNAILSGSYNSKY
uniref:Ribosomal protein S2 n=1 Tax=Reclinomonas americana TaxID=48483 RepID=O21288_RECAM|nr:ribosomal protein S2 [Reclinomonas americana]AAD11918.1 ribosomal protein S2 [Reclinomonas americana]